MPRRAVLAAVAAGVVVLVLGAVVASRAARPGADRVDGGPSASSLPGGDPTVGALFVGPDDIHDCTASVVASSTGDVIIGAAHCLDGPLEDVSFAPAYHDDVAPYGRWQVTAAYLPPTWLSGTADDADVAVLTVAPRDGKRLQDVVGANRLGTTPAAGTVVTVIAYASGSGDRALTCTRPITVTDGFPTLTCHGFVGGSSGSPFLVGAGTARAVTGVLGGLHGGGCSEDISYAVPFGPVEAALVARAEARDPADVAPSPPSDGC